MKDYFGVNSDILKKKKLFLFDMDGTIYNEDTIFDGTIDFLNYIESIGGRYIFITNNSSKSVEDYLLKVRKMGIKAEEENFYTSSQATCKYIKENYQDPLVFLMGTKSLKNEFLKEKIRFCEDIRENIDLIVMGYDTELTYDKIRKISELLATRDLPYIATNPDLVCPVSFGYVPDCGSIANILKVATGKYPIFIGKPEPTMINFVMEKYGYSKEETLVVGDRIYTDIASGLNAGVTSVLLLSGEATLKTLEEDKRKPDLVFSNIKDLYNATKV